MKWKCVRHTQPDNYERFRNVPDLWNTDISVEPRMKVTKNK
jgi:hypothetical protein